MRFREGILVGSFLLVEGLAELVGSFSIGKDLERGRLDLLFGVLWKVLVLGSTSQAVPSELLQL